MTLLAAAQEFFGLIDSPARLANCYWYGFGTGVSHEGYVVPSQTRDDACAPIPLNVPAATIAWPGQNTFPFIGTWNAAGSTRAIALTDCSGFVGWLLHGLSPNLLTDYLAYISAGKKNDPDSPLVKLDRLHGDQPWPSAADYAYAGAFGSLPPSFTLVGDKTTLAARLQEGAVQPGHILAWSLAQSQQDTGHVVIVDSVTADSDQSWTLSVYDASSVAHSNDTRPGGTGVGNGSIALMTSSGAWTGTFQPGTEKPFIFDIDQLAVLTPSVQMK